MLEKWTYAPEGDSDGELVGTDHFVIDEKGDEIACPGTEKQARLIAAAPDLLAAAREAVMFWYESKGVTQDEFRSKAAKVEDALRLAIAKAEGR